MELTQAQQRVATLSAERDEAVERLAAGTSGDDGHGQSVEVGARVSAILSLADEEAGPGSGRGRAVRGRAASIG